jgi:hypothetical protein
VNNQEIWLTRKFNAELSHLPSSAVDPHLFNADPYPAFYLNADPDPGSQTNADPDPRRTLKSPKVEFLQEKYTLGTESRYR